MRLIVLLLAVLLTLPCHADHHPSMTDLVTAHRAFAFDLYRTISGRDGNLFLSPHSISIALLMTSAGARGETARQMQAALRLPSDDPAPHAAARDLNTALMHARVPGHVELHEANGLWPATGFELNNDFLTLLQEMYRTDLEALDFTRPVEAAAIINAWIEKQTRDLLKNVVSPDALSPMTRLVLANAIYFKGDWLLPFDENMTAAGPFTLADGSRLPIPMMRGEFNNVSYAKLDDLALLALPYTGRTMSMLVALPDRHDGLPALEEKLSHALFATWLEALQRRTVQVVMPTFTLTSEFALNQVLMQLGMVDAFQPGGADLSGIGSRPGDLFISDVFHKAYVDVNEKGTEAAAVTTVTIRATSISMDPYFVADKPFLFFILDHETQSILFMGRFLRP